MLQLRNTKATAKKKHTHTKQQQQKYSLSQMKFYVYDQNRSDNCTITATVYLLAKYACFFSDNQFVFASQVREY